MKQDSKQDSKVHLVRMIVSSWAEDYNIATRDRAKKAAATAAHVALHVGMQVRAWVESMPHPRVGVVIPLSRAHSWALQSDFHNNAVLLGGSCSCLHYNPLSDNAETHTAAVWAGHTVHNLPLECINCGRRAYSAYGKDAELGGCVSCLNVMCSPTCRDTDTSVSPTTWPFASSVCRECSRW